MLRLLCRCLELLVKLALAKQLKRKDISQLACETHALCQTAAALRSCDQGQLARQGGVGCSRAVLRYPSGA